MFSLRFSTRGHVRPSVRPSVRFKLLSHDGNRCFKGKESSIGIDNDAMIDDEEVASYVTLW